MRPARALAAFLALAGLVGLLGFQRLPARAADEEVERLRSRVVELEEKVSQLEALLRLQQESARSGDEPQVPIEYGWQNTKKWRGLRMGMNEEEVKQALGEPIKVISGVRTLWYYPNIYCGYVSFDEDGRLNGWSEP